MKNMNIIVLKQGDKVKILKKILNFYCKKGNRNEYKKGILKSSYIIIGLKKNKIIGVVRVLTDGFQNALIVDLLVSKNNRNNGVGSKLLKKSIKVCEDKNIKNIQLVSDPNITWLENFYIKNGFENDTNKHGKLFVYSL